jgi:hypothetical protein
VIGRRWNFRLRGLQELLVAAVDQLRNLATDQVSRIRENLYPILVGLLDRRRHVIFSEEHAPVRAWRFGHVEPVIAQPS